MKTSPLYLWQIGRRPLLAYAATDRGSRLRGVSLFPRTGLKRRLLVRAVQVAIGLRLDGFCCRRRAGAGAPAPADLDVLLDQLHKHCKGEALDWLLIWPARPERRRLYLAFRCRPSRLAGVIKIGEGEFNRRQLRNEAAMLAGLAGHQHPFAVPSVLLQRDLAGNRTALALTGFPEPMQSGPHNLVVLTGARIALHLAALPAPERHMSLRQTAWFPLLVERVPDCEAVRRVKQMADARMDVGWAHGDLGPGNMMPDGTSGIFLFDWENASMQAPVLTDMVALWLACRQRETLRHPAVTVNAIRQDFKQESEDRLLLALVFLAAHDNLAAKQLLQNWK